MENMMKMTYKIIWNNMKIRGNFTYDFVKKNNEFKICPKCNEKFYADKTKTKKERFRHFKNHKRYCDGGGDNVQL